MPIERSAGGGGSGGGLTLLFDQELVGAAATIDTGANGIAGTSKHLYLEFYARSSDAGTGGFSAGIRFNNDSGANYDDAYMRNAAGAVSAASDQAQTSAFFCQVPGNGNTAGYFATAHANVISYAEVTAGFKSGNSVNGFAYNTAAVQQITIQYVWRSTAVITRVAILMQSGSNFLAGSRLTIYGTP